MCIPFTTNNSKGSIGQPPYTLVYGKESRLPIHLELNALAIAMENDNTK